MSSPPAIRLLAQNDLKVVRYLLGLSIMEPLGRANNEAYFHPLTIASWMALSAVMVQLMGWWPKSGHGWFGYLSPLPALAAVAVPLMFFFDWIHRPAFDARVQKELTAPDMRDPLGHYSRSPASGFYILENKGKIIGLIAVDASPPSASDSPVTKPSKGKKEPTAETAVIRHFFVEEAYRQSEVQVDLLELALSRTFTATSAPLPSAVRILSSDLASYKQSAIRASRFGAVSKWDEKEPQEWTVGVYKWKNQWVELSRKAWQAGQDKKS
ncbi:hypothetical protein BU17DRAFT_41133 [Hysterangium stoloniferum]|nr:hypothetical protein BU17DRAFT_41133 [Hysterangium stoloniferum]